MTDVGGCALKILLALQAGIQNAATASAAIGAVNVIGTIIAGSLIEKAGRVQLLTVSFGGMCLSMFAMVAGRTIPALASSAGEPFWFSLLTLLCLACCAGEQFQFTRASGRITPVLALTSALSAGGTFSIHTTNEESCPTPSNGVRNRGMPKLSIVKW